MKPGARVDRRPVVPDSDIAVGPAPADRKLRRRDGGQQPPQQRHRRVLNAVELAAVERGP